MGELTFVERLERTGNWCERTDCILRLAKSAHQKRQAIEVLDNAEGPCLGPEPEGIISTRITHDGEEISHSVAPGRLVCQAAVIAAQRQAVRDARTPRMKDLW